MGKGSVRILLAFWIAATSLGAQQATPPKFEITPEIKAALARISADSLRGHLSFIASDALEGRNTPSRGLDIAAEYIAAQFRRAGLEPVGDDGYFQTVNWMVAERNMDDFELRIRDGKEMIIVSKNQVSTSFDGALNLARAGIIKIDYKDTAAISALKPEQTEGRIFITEIPDFRSAAQTQRMDMYRAQSEFMSKASALKAAL